MPGCYNHLSDIDIAIKVPEISQADWPMLEEQMWSTVCVSELVTFSFVRKN
jgi:hypothetical protein